MSSEAFHSVEAAFTEEEVNIAVFELGGDHTPTPDDFFVIFFFSRNLERGDAMLYLHELYSNSCLQKDRCLFYYFDPKKWMPLLK